jgi:hypothetical protein
MVLATRFGVESEDLVTPACKLGEVVKLDRTRDRVVWIVSPEESRFERRVGKREVDVLRRDILSWVNILA